MNPLADGEAGVIDLKTKHFPKRRKIMAFCTNCKSKIEEGDKCCPVCGSPAVRNGVADEQQNDCQPQKSYPEKVRRPSHRGRKKVLIILGCVVLALILIAAAWILLLKSRFNPPTLDPDPSVGAWHATHVFMGDQYADIDNFFDEGVTIRLKEGGAFDMTVNGADSLGEWYLEDDVLNFTDDTGTFSGFIDGDVMVLSSTDKDTGLILERNGCSGMADAFVESRGKETAVEPQEAGDAVTGTIENPSK